MEQASPRSRLSFRIAQLIAGIVAIGWIILSSLYVRGRLQLGYWPRRNLDDPKQLDLGFHYEVAEYGFAALAIGTVALVVLPGIAAVLDRESWKPTIALAFSVVALSVALFYLSPIARWYLD